METETTLTVQEWELLERLVQARSDAVMPGLRLMKAARSLVAKGFATEDKTKSGGTFRAAARGCTRIAEDTL